MNNVSPTVFRRRVSDHAYGAWLMEHMANEHHAAMVSDVHRKDERKATERPMFFNAYWDAFCEDRPVMAWVVVGMLIIGAMVAVRV